MENTFMNHCEVQDMKIIFFHQWKMPDVAVKQWLVPSSSQSAKLTVWRLQRCKWILIAPGNLTYFAIEKMAQSK